ncbi:MAG: hypothetical protein JWM96_997 [Alphaproteobacteria bacterium]|nr:hypothetical protein [Alphaproteobacteria bacterium]
MTSRFLSSLCLFALLLAFSVPIQAFADQDVVKALQQTTDMRLQVLQQDKKELYIAYGLAFEGLKKQIIAVNTARFADEVTPDPYVEVIKLSQMTPVGLAVSDGIAQYLMSTNMRQLNRVPVTNDVADLYVNGALNADVGIQAFHIYMRYFCDPQSRGGTMEDKEFVQKHVYYKGAMLDNDITMGCGYVKNSDMPTRATYLAAKANNGLEADQIIGLPTRADRLYFNAGTFPTTAKKEPTDADPTNTNRMAQVYEAAFSQSMLLLLGDPPAAPQSNDLAGDAGTYLENQKQVAVKAAATYPFALAFAEQTGTMGPDAAQAAAFLLRTKLAGATTNPDILAQINSLNQRNSISVAELSKIIDYQLVTSPGYFQRISTMRPSQLKREAVWLLARQTALRWEQKRWQEISTMLEAMM